ncbi:hypothetical protein ABT024_04900 [Streptomyces sp. NPDC002812]|uniref:hypothetical protein n=1 Tax=Streptomyces sp. NPDC002812 TaxID=3154434 RepID=UPI003316703F
MTLPPPDPGFLPGIKVDARCTTGRAPLVTFFHPHAHRQNSATGMAMLAIAARLRLRYGTSFPRTDQYLYYLSGAWCLDYGHPQDLLHFPVGPVWSAMAHAAGGALVAVSLEHEPRPADERLLTGRLALRYEAPPDWPKAR